MASYVVGPGDARLVADALVRYQLGRPRLVLSALAGLIVVVLLATVAHATATAAVVAVVMLAVYLFAAVRVRRRLVRLLHRNALRPGAELLVHFGAESFTVASGSASAQRAYGAVASVQVVRGVVIVGQRDVRTVLALPMPAVGDDGLERLRAAAGRP